MRSHYCMLIAAGAIAGSAHAQGHLYSIGEGSGWNSTAAVVGDANGDGISDFAISHSSTSSTIQVRSGEDGALILVMPTDEKTNMLAAAGDVDKDGEVDLVAGYHFGGGHPAYVGRARVFRAADGALIHDHPGGVNDHFVGLRVAGGVDLDQDGFDDYLIRSDTETRARSGATGDVLHTTSHGSGAAGLTGLGDVDDDGFDDWAVGTAAPSSGSVRVLSGESGSILFEVSGAKERQWFGYAIAPSPDLDGDDRPDLLVGIPGDGTYHYDKPGRVRVLSGSNGATIRTWKGKWKDDGFGRAVTTAGDVDGDGVQDVLVGAPFDQTAGDGAGQVALFSGATGKTLFTRFGSHKFCLLGKGVGALGDVDADGVPDILADRKGDQDVSAVVSAYSGWGAEFQIGTGVAGTIKQYAKLEPTDVDELFFAGVAGQKLTFDFEVLSGDLKPRIAVVDAAGKTLKQLSFVGKNSAPKSYLLKKTGHYRLRIRGLKDAKKHHTEGAYRVGTDCTFKGNAAPQTVVRKGKPGKTLVVKLDALPGATLHGTIIPGKYDGALPSPTLKMPGGESFDLGKFATLESDGTITLTDIPLATLGRHELRIPTAPTGKSKVLFELDLVQPKGTGSVDAY